MLQPAQDSLTPLTLGCLLTARTTCFPVLSLRLQIAICVAPSAEPLELACLQVTRCCEASHSLHAGLGCLIT